MSTPTVSPSSFNQNQSINLLSDKFHWKVVNDADILNRTGELVLVAKTEKDNRTYNRAFLQTQLNSSSFEGSVNPFLIMSLVYTFKSANGSADVAIEIRDPRDNSVLASHELIENLTTAKFPLAQNIIDKPVEFRLYVITDGPGFHVLDAKEFRVSEENNTVREILSAGSLEDKSDEAWNSYSKSLVFDDKGVPYYNYGYVKDLYIGLQRYPITIEAEALRFYDQYQRISNPKNETSKQFFLNNADWLVNNTIIKRYNDTLVYGIFDHTFPWPHYKLEPPWQSGMAQGRALIVMVRAHELTGDQRYLDTAKLILNSFFVDVKDGGITEKTRDSGWWYEEYASSNTNAINDSRVLNGMIFAVQGIHEYYKYTNDPIAKFLFDQGILALKNDLPKYDNNGESLYDALGTSSGEEYHKLHISQLKELYDLTSDVIFKQYHDKWDKTVGQ